MIIYAVESPDHAMIRTCWCGIFLFRACIITIPSQSIMQNQSDTCLQDACHSHDACMHARQIDNVKSSVVTLGDSAHRNI
jgi:hypothetical protein